MGRGTWQATVHWVTKELDTTEQLTNTSLNRGWDFFFFLTINGKNSKYQCITKNKGIVTHLAENKSRSGLKSWEAFDCKQFFSPFLGGSVVKNLPAMQETPGMRVDHWVREIPRRRAWQLTPIFLPGESHG